MNYIQITYVYIIIANKVDDIMKILKYIVIVLIFCYIAYYYPEIIAGLIMSLIEFSLAYGMYRLIKYLVIKLIKEVKNGKHFIKN